MVFYDIDIGELHTLGAEGLWMHTTDSIRFKSHERQSYIFLSVKSLQPHPGHRQQSYEMSSNMLMATRECTSIRTRGTYVHMEDTQLIMQ